MSKHGETMMASWRMFALAALLAGSPALAQGQPPTGTLPPAEQQPAEPPTQPTPTQPPPTQPPPTQPQPTQPPTQPQPTQPQAAPPPGYYPPPYYGPRYEPPPPTPPAPKVTRRVSLTLSPLHLILPMFEAMIELRAVDGFGIAAIGGYGKVTAEDNLGERHDFNAYELGGQLVWYPLEAFDSLQVGAEILYVKLETDELANATVTGIGDGLAIGPLIGYKLLTSGGFTFVVQGGIEYLAIHAEAESQSGQTDQADEKRVIPLINLNLGWSF